MRARIVSAFAVVAGLLACHSPLSPARPSSLNVTERLEMTGPSRLAPGETAQFRLMSVDAGGAARDVTNSATWTSFKPQVASVTNGAVTGNAMGDVTIAAVYERSSRSQPLTVLTPGTFRLTGLVREQELAVPVANASVQASGDGAATAETTTGLDGRFTLYGVPRIADLRVTKGGYFALTRQLDLESASSIELALQPAMPRPDFSGTYRLTITAAECKATSLPLPRELGQRVYTATVTQVSNGLDVVVSGASFLSANSAVAHFTGTAEILGASFSLAAADYYYARTQPELVERLGDATMLVISGVAATTLSGRTLSGTLKGSMIQTTGSPFGPMVSQCVSSAMPFVMTRP